MRRYHLIKNIGQLTLAYNYRSRIMNILVACEESQEVCKAFREKGHNAFSCDVQECSGGHPEWHIKGDVIKLLNGGNFITMDFKRHIIKKWDLIIAHPPCTHLCVSGARHFEEKRKNGQQELAIKFFIKFLDCNCEKVSCGRGFRLPYGMRPWEGYRKRSLFARRCTEKRCFPPGHRF